MHGKVYTFGPFRLEADERRLLRDDQLVPLAGKAFDTLLLLVQGAGTLQHQRTLLDRGSSSSTWFITLWVRSKPGR